MNGKSEELNDFLSKTDNEVHGRSFESMTSFVRKYNIPVDKNLVTIARVYFSLQITILAAILWMPLGNHMRTVAFLSLCLILDMVRMLVWRPLRALVFTPQSLLIPTHVTLDARTKREGLIASLFFVACASLPFAVVLIPDNISRILSDAVSHVPYISSLNSIQKCGFSSPANERVSFDFLVFLQIICLVYLIYLSIASVRLWDYRSIFDSNFFTLQGQKAKDIGNILSISIAALLCLIVFYYFLSPRPSDAGHQNYDWLGPVAMWMYGIIEFAILLVFQAINKALLLSIQAFFFVSKN